MSDIKKTVQTLLTNETKMTGSECKVANFAYTDEAYNNNDMAGTLIYDYGKEQNIPLGTPKGMDSNITTLTKGYRSMGSSIARMVANHFFGRCSYNLNKIHDWFKEFLTAYKETLKGSILLWNKDTNYSTGEYCFTYTGGTYRLYKALKEGKNNTPAQEGDTFWELLKVRNAENLGTLLASTWETQVRGVKVANSDNSDALGTLLASTWETQVEEKVTNGTAASAVMLENDAVIEAVGPNGTAVVNRSAVKAYLKSVMELSGDASGGYTLTINLDK